MIAPLDVSAQIPTVAAFRRMDNPARAAICRGMTQTSDILIVGGGLNGPAMALALSQAGHSVTVIDSLGEKIRKNAAFDGRSYALALASVRLLRAIGIWDRVSENAQPMLEIKVTDGRAGEGPSPFFMHFDHAEIEEGPMGHMLEDRFLRRAFLEAMDETAGITHLAGETVIAQEVTHSGVSVTLASGKILAGRLLIGSDGRGSGTADPGRYPAHRLGIWSDRAGLRHRARAAPSRHCASVLHATRATGDPAPAGQCQLDRLERDRRNRRPVRRACQTMISWKS